MPPCATARCTSFRTTSISRFGERWERLQAVIRPIFLDDELTCRDGYESHDEFACARPCVGNRIDGPYRRLWSCQSTGPQGAVGNGHARRQAAGTWGD